MVTNAYLYCKSGVGYFAAIVDLVGVYGLGSILMNSAAPRVAELTDSAHISSGKVRATFHLPEDLMNEARNTVVALSGPPYRLTLAKLAENALRSELERLKSDREGHQRGKDFPQRTDEVRTGRPIGNR